MSTQSDLMDRVATMEADVKHLRAALHSGVWQRMGDYADGPPTSRPDGMGGYGGGFADPTAVAALGRNRSMATQHRLDLHAAMVDIAEALHRALLLAGLYPARDTAELLTLAKGDPGCESCARTTGPTGAKRWEPIKANLRGRTSVDERLPRALFLCRWCYDAVLAWDRLPTVDELELHHAGRRVPWPADVARPIEAV
jgi:hypothetical protein